ncbi:MAG: MerR family transcriptional regulator [Bacteroidetes bacterium]|nr:MerR family transcriptional regulator [Bacteroidota bacterium]MBL6943128.1 MerR family transcriptional regulator [Bacteroidales bacterium]
MASKIYFKIGDVANKFNVNTSLIRYWEQEFDFIKPKKNNKGTRYYTNKDIDNFELIHHLVKEKGMTIQGVKDYIVHRKQNSSLEKVEVIVTLKRTRELLVDIREILNKKNEINIV